MQFPNHSLITYNIILEEEGEKRKKEERNRKPANWRGKC